ncbi:MAG: helix-turn-helix domain-containing protein, partial [Calditrichia bacterium]
NLKQKREEKGVTLEYIYRKTFLPIQYLQAIESGKMEQIPEGYDRIYLKRYASEIGLDVEEVLRDYDLISGRLTPSYSPPKKTAKTLNSRRQRSRITFGKAVSKDNRVRKIIERLNLDKVHKYFWIGFAVFIFLIIAFFTYRAYLNEKRNEIVITEITSLPLANTEGVTEPASLPPADNINLSPADKPAKNGDAEKFVVELHAVDTTWIRQIKDGRDTSEYILPKGIRHRVEVKNKVRFVVGKASGIEVWLNGKNLGTLGGEDEVVTRLIILKDGIKEKRLKKVVKKTASKPDSTVANVLAN